MSDCIFCKIIEKKLPAAIIFEDERVLAFEDIDPQAPVHLLVIPKKHIASLSTAQPEDEALLGYLLHVGARLAQQRGVDESGYRTVINTNRGAGQTVFHIHVHILGGRPLRWPPG